MNFEKLILSNVNIERNWPDCPSCDYNDENSNNLYHERSKESAGDKNKQNNGKSCVSG